MPDLTEKVVGFRYWRATNGWLQSQGVGELYWGRGVNEARCEQGSGMTWGGYAAFRTSAMAPNEPRHAAPANGCTCGLHAYHKPPSYLADRGPFHSEALCIPGAIKAWGRMEVHENGFRAQYAEVVALAYNEMWPQAMVDLVRAAARSYEVDCVPADRLEVFALEQGQPVPADMRPEVSQSAPSHDLVAIGGSWSGSWSISGMTCVPVSPPPMPNKRWWRI